MNIAVARVVETDLPLAYLNQVGGQDELVFDGASFVLTPTAGSPSSLPRGRRRSLVTDWAQRRRLALPEPATRRARRGGRRGRLPRAACWASRLREQERLSRRRARALRRHRLRAGRGGRRRRAGRGARALRDDAVALHLEGKSGRRGARAPKRSACATTPCRSHEPVDGFGEALRQDPSRARTPDITEENIQSRVRGATLMAISNKFGAHGADDRQQERDVGRLRHALRRHVRRLQSAQGPLQDGGLRALALAQRARAEGRARTRRPRHPREHHRRSRRPRSCATNQTDQDSLPPYAVLDDILECLVEQRDAARPTSSRAATRPRR